jgi:hypothetical protein
VLRRGLVLVVLAGLIGVGALALVQRHQRAEEWADGADAVDARAEVVTATPAQLPEALARFGVDGELGVSRTPQAVVAHVTWDGTPSSGGTYEFVLLDDRLSPPRPLRAYGGWGSDGPTGSGWDGRFDVLGEHYPWLAGTTPVRTGAGWADRAEAIGVPATGTGEATLAFHLDRDDLPTGDAAGDLVLAMVFVHEDGDVRWARQIPLHPA